VHEVLQRHCRTFAIVQLRATSELAQEHVYHLRLVAADRKGLLAQELAGLGGVEEVSILSHEAVLGS
jgi:hypothetical protein